MTKKFSCQGIANGCCNDSGQVADQSERGLKGHGHAISQSSINNIRETVGKGGDAVLYQNQIITKTCHDTGVQEKIQRSGLHTTHLQDKTLITL